MNILIGIDDTDNLESRGTGFRARCLGAELQEKGFGKLIGVSRHQLYVHKDIPYTSHNSSLCIEFELSEDISEKLVSFCSDYLKVESAPGSDPGLCIANSCSVTQDIIEFGKRAKNNIVTKNEAYEKAKIANIHLSEHGGTGGGVIGALAGVGLRVYGNDGRFVIVKGIREMTGVYTVEDILNQSGVEAVMTESGEALQKDEMVDVGDWFRPVLIDGKPTLIVEKAFEQRAGWKIIDKEKIKARH